MTRPPWLRLQRLKFSPWLLAVIFGWMVVSMLPYVFWEQHLHGSSFGDAVMAVIKEMPETRPSIYNIVPTVIVMSGLLWFTYFSGSKRVKDPDKLGVFLMFCSGAIGLIRQAVHYLFHV